MDFITIALPKGKLFPETVALLKKAGLISRKSDYQEDSRQLLLTEEDSGARLILARPSDVPVYVEHGAADLGIVGKDVLLEERPAVIELLDLGLGPCHFAMAVPAEKAGAFPPTLGRLKVATKFPRVTEAYLAKRRLSAEIIYLRGAVELAPQVGLAQAILDLVSTGRTLRENGLVEVERVADSAARLIANEASFLLKKDKLEKAVEAIKQALLFSTGPSQL
ncbi:MAG: ATP phosphoribosyltransferase [Firmicutes bacterium]|nr:ATP phosphoribosyltransferase [Bacillota bacterium]MCL5040074.1 ATP phosphoribosyltransferase [Bacillota bacterium]